MDCLEGRLTNQGHSRSKSEIGPDAGNLSNMRGLGAGLPWANLEQCRSVSDDEMTSGERGRSPGQIDGGGAANMMAGILL